jgi:serine/threonine-protein kinase
MDHEERLKAALADRYRIEREIGSGGMAKVYLAQDLKHGRQVAVKVLDPELAQTLGAERFLREIETAANLTHPHILPLFDSGEVEGFLYYVMPFVDGESLSGRLEREKQLPFVDAIQITREIADALAYAHEKGVIHRDVKPANIMLEAGHAVLADFGVAQAVAGAGEERITRTGLSVGTPSYMSPEQAAGDPELDARSDLYSLGAVTYEMLVGEPPHVARTAQAVVAKILSEKPAPVRRTRDFVPVNVEAAVAKALARSPADRFSSTAEFAAALADPGYTVPSMAVGGDGAAEAIGRRWLWVTAALAAVALVASGLALWDWLRPKVPAAVGFSVYALAFPEGEEPLDLWEPAFDVSAGGAVIVYVGPGPEGQQLWVKHRDQATATPLPGTSGAGSPTISPDGSEVAFVAEAELKKVPLSGGPPITLAFEARQSQVSWTADGHLIYADRGWQLRRISTVGGTPEDLWPDHPAGWYAFSPASIGDSDNILFVVCEITCANYMATWVLDGRAGEARELILDAGRAWHLNSGHVAFFRPEEGILFGAPFDSYGLVTTGPAIPLLEGIQQTDTGYPELALASDGTLLMVEGPTSRALSEPNQELIWVDREGVVEPVSSEWRIASALNVGFALSPDGTRLAIGLLTDAGDDIYVKDLDRGSLDRLTYDPAEDSRPRWSPDGRFVYYLSRRGDGQADLWVRRADGATEPHLVLSREPFFWDSDATPDGDWIVARVGGVRDTTGARNIIAYHMVGDTAEVPIAASPYDETSPRLSPDGRWLAYSSQETGAWEIYVRPFPDVRADRRLVSRGGGVAPLWSHNGREIFYQSLDSMMMAASVDTAGGGSVGEPEILFELPPGIALNALTTTYDVSPDAQRFIMVRRVQDETAEERFQLILVENFLEEVKQRMRGQGG